MNIYCYLGLCVLIISSSVVLGVVMCPYMNTWDYIEPYISYQELVNLWLEPYDYEPVLY